MKKFFRRLRGEAGKPLQFGLYGALGCLLAALLWGELLLALTQLPPRIDRIPQAIALLIDASGSMGGQKLTEVKAAATDFVRRQEQSEDMFAAIGFGSKVRVAANLTSDRNSIQRAIASLGDGGGTQMAQGINAAVAELQKTSLSRNILLFTDGLPNSKGLTLAAAKSAKTEGINIIAVGTGDADTNYLTQLTGDPAKVFYAQSGEFDRAFRDAEKVIYGRQILETGPTGDYPLIYAILRIGSWTACLALGTSLALIVGQNYYLRRRLLTLPEAIKGASGSLIAGIIAGAAGQLLFGLVATNAWGWSAVSRTIAWTILGGFLGRGMAWFVPNLDKRRALLAGSGGGAVGALGFLLAASIFSDVVGRLLSAAILGFCIGWTIALIEKFTRSAWLVVNWTPKEQTIISLGEKPVLLGSSLDAHIYLRKDQGFPPVAVKIYMQGGEIILDNLMTEQQQNLSDDQKINIGGLTLKVKTGTTGT